MSAETVEIGARRKASVKIVNFDIFDQRSTGAAISAGNRYADPTPILVTAIAALRSNDLQTTDYHTLAGADPQATPLLKFGQIREPNPSWLAPPSSPTSASEKLNVVGFEILLLKLGSAK